MNVYKNVLTTLAMLSIAASPVSVNADSCGVNDSCFSANSCDSCNSWEVYADWLYLNPRRCGLDYAIPSTGSVVVGHVYAVEPSYDSGFRLGALKSCGSVDYGLRYTCFHTDEKNSVTEAAAGNLGRTRLAINIADGADSLLRFAEGKYDLDYDLLDLEIGYDYDLSGCMSARFFSGFRFAFIDQTFDVTYAADADDLEGTGSGNFVNLFKQKNNLDLYGVYFGFNPNYSFNKCFDFFGSFSYGALVGEFDRSAHLDSTPGTDTAFSERIDLKDSCWKYVVNVDVVVGMKYSLCNTGCGDWTLSLGYEFHDYSNFSDFLNFYSGDFPNEKTFDRNDSNFTIDGLVMRLAASF